MSVDDAQRLVARADLCRFIAGCYYQPEAAFIEERLFESMHDVAVRVDVDLAERARRLGEAFVADDLQMLLVDYTRLFLGPVDALAQPYGSVWLDDGKSLMQDSTMDVLRLYAEGGFEINEEFRDLPDHVAAELEFVYLLLFRQAQARASRDGAACDDAQALQRRFLGAHLGRWIGEFAAAIERGAQTGFYRELAALTQLVVRREVAGGADS